MESENNNLKIDKTASRRTIISHDYLLMMKCTIDWLYEATKLNELNAQATNNNRK